jgi:predicted dehydrogenase
MEAYGRHQRIGQRFAVGVVGLGEGKGLIKGLMGHPDLPVTAVCDTDPSRLAEVKHSFGVPDGYTTLDELLEHADIQILVIFTPDQLHKEHIAKGLAAGKHVICTKPLVASLAEASEVLAHTKRYPHQRLMVGQSSRFFGPMQAQRRAAASQSLGVLSFAEAQYVHDMGWFYNNRSWATSGGLDLIFGGCSHPVDLLRWHMGDVDEVSALADRSQVAEEAGFDGQDTFVINMKFTSGRVGRVLGLFGLEQPHATRPWIEVALYGHKGTFIAKYPQLESTIKLLGQPERVEHAFEDGYHYFQFEGVNHHAGEFVNYTEYFARCLVSGEHPQPDAEDGFKTIATLEAIRESIRTGATTKVARVNEVHA